MWEWDSLGAHYRDDPRTRDRIILENNSSHNLFHVLFPIDGPVFHPSFEMERITGTSHIWWDSYHQAIRHQKGCTFLSFCQKKGILSNFYLSHKRGSEGPSSNPLQVCGCWAQGWFRDVAAKGCPFLTWCGKRPQTTFSVLVRPCPILGEVPETIVKAAKCLERVLLVYANVLFEWKRKSF